MFEPFSTWTNAAYASAGVWVLAHAFIPVHVVLGVALIGLAVSSAVYHNTAKSQTDKPTAGQRWDEVAMYAVLCALLCNIGAYAAPSLPWAHIAIWCAFGLGAVHYAVDSFLIVPALGALCGVAAAVLIGPFVGLGFLAWFALAGFIRSIGEQAKQRHRHGLHELCHSAWHAMTGGAIPALWSILFL